MGRPRAGCRRDRDAACKRHRCRGQGWRGSLATTRPPALPSCRPRADRPALPTKSAEAVPSLPARTRDGAGFPPSRRGAVHPSFTTAQPSSRESCSRQVPRSRAVPLSWAVSPARGERRREQLGSGCPRARVPAVRPFTSELPEDVGGTTRLPPSRHSCECAQGYRHVTHLVRDEGNARPIGERLYAYLSLLKTHVVPAMGKTSPRDGRVGSRGLGVTRADHLDHPDDLRCSGTADAVPARNVCPRVKGASIEECLELESLDQWGASLTMLSWARMARRPRSTPPKQHGCCH